MPFVGLILSFAMKILLVSSSIDLRSGGPTRSVKGLCRALDRAGQSVTLQVLRGGDAFEERGGVNVIYGQQNPGPGYDIVHLQGLWDPALHRVAVDCRKKGVPYVISPRGMLAPWALSVKKWKKKLAMLAYQRHDLQHAAAFHATASAEADHIRAAGFDNLVIVSPNGVDLPSALPLRQQRDFHSDDFRTAIFMGRLHPGKGLVTLAKAWTRVKPRGWKMRIVGPDLYGHQSEVEAVLRAGGVLRDWQFVGAVGDEEKWAEYAVADLMIHPSVSENFGITIAEGLASGLPVICTKGTPWQEVVDRNCGWWIDLGVESLAETLGKATAMPSEKLESMGLCGRKLIEDSYSWAGAARCLVEGYGQVLSCSPNTKKLL